MSVFSKAKQLNELRKMSSQAKKMQNQLKEITETVTIGDNIVKVTGDQKVEFMQIDGVERRDIADLVNDAFKNIQKRAAQKMLESGDLSSLFGGM